MELKKTTLISSVNNEIQTAQQQISNAQLQIGKSVYDAHLRGSDGAVDHSERFDEIKSLEKLIEEKEAKKKDIQSRYDDEIGMLRSSITIPSTPAQPNTVTQGGPTCSGCNKPYTQGVDKFCMGCGKGLEDSASPSAQGGQAKCSGCGKPYNPNEDAFCMGCGNKLG